MGVLERHGKVLYFFVSERVWTMITDRIMFRAVCVIAAWLQQMAECKIEQIVFKGQTTLGDTRVKSCHLVSSQISCITGIYQRRTIRMQRAVQGCLALHVHMNRCRHMEMKVPAHTRWYQRRNHQTVQQTGWSVISLTYELCLHSTAHPAVNKWWITAWFLVK